MVLGLPEPYGVGLEVIPVDLKDRHYWRADGEQATDLPFGDLANVTPDREIFSYRELPSYRQATHIAAPLWCGEVWYGPGIRGIEENSVPLSFFLMVTGCPSVFRTSSQNLPLRLPIRHSLIDKA
jgi:hypothetical protein